jgi:hypothetical protein
MDLASEQQPACMHEVFLINNIGGKNNQNQHTIKKILFKALTVFPEVQRTLMSSPSTFTTSPAIQASSGSSTQTRDPTTGLIAAA